MGAFIRNTSQCSEWIHFEGGRPWWESTNHSNQIKMNNNRQCISMFKSNSSVAFQLVLSTSKDDCALSYFVWDLQVYFLWHTHAHTHPAKHKRTNRLPQEIACDPPPYCSQSMTNSVALPLSFSDNWASFYPTQPKPISTGRQAYIRYAWGSELILGCHSLLVLGFPVCCCLMYLFSVVLSPYLI